MLKQFSLIVFGGASTAETVLRPIVDMGIRMSNVYGQTETCGVVTATDPDASPKVLAETIGRALPGTKIRVADALGNRLPLGQNGEIQVKSPSCMTGYFNQEDATRLAFTADGYLRTGDIGVENKDGSFSFIGRLKEMFKSGGYNIYPVEVELALQSHSAVDLAAVLPIPDKLYQEVGIAFIETSDPNLSSEMLKIYLKSILANYKIPKKFVFKKELPKLANGKIDKLSICRQIESGDIYDQ